MMMKYFYTLIAICFLINISNAKNNISGNNTYQIPPHRTCGSEKPSQNWENDFQQKIQQFKASQVSNRAPLTNYTIPVIVHVVYWNASENISQAQVNSQIDILNADYAGTGLNSNNVPAAFASLKANTNITFCKAAKDPNGNTLAEPGIDRVNAQTKGFTNPGSGWSSTYITSTIKPATTWDATKYMNIWVLPLGNQLLGYATFPGGPANIDGVVIGHFYYGNTGVVQAPYNKGRTATHEVGHWLGLYHISGDQECGDDLCNDTPAQLGGNNDPNPGSGLNYGCPTYPFQVNSCSAGASPNGEMFMNFMDYVDDACMYMFSNDQRTRIQTTMSTIPMRASLSSSNVCSVVPTAPVANFSGTPTSVCPGSTVAFTDLSSGSPTSWSWSFPGGTPSTSINQNPIITYNSAGTYAVTLTATNNLGSDPETKTGYITVATPTPTALPLIQGFEGTTFPPTGWSLVSRSTNNWQRTTAAGGFGASTASMYFDNTNLDASGLKDDILTPVISFPSNVVNPRIKFDVAYSPYTDVFGQIDDTLEVLAYDVCAGTYTSVYKKGGNQLSTAAAQGAAFIPTATQWRKDSVNISNTLLNKNIKFVFRNSGLYSHEIYVDNVNIYTTSTTSSTPTASFTTSDTTVCVGSNLIFTNTSISGNATSVDSVRWTINGGIPSTSTSLTTVTSTFNTVGSYVISLKAYEAGIGSAVVTKSIRVKALPTVAAITGSASICAGLNTTYSSTTTGGIWSSSNTSIATVNANGLVSGIASGSAEIRYTVTNGGCSTMVTKVITVNASPVVAAITGATSVCAGLNTTYSTTTTGGVWSSSNTSIATVNSGGLVNGVANGSAEIRYTVTSGGCSTMVTKVITVNAVPVVAAITGSASVCAGLNTIYSTTTTGGVWSSSNTSIATVNANGLVIGVANGSAEIRYTVTNGGCSTMVTKVITVNASPVVAAITGATSVCAGLNTTYSTTTTGGVWSSSNTSIATVNANGLVTGVASGSAEIRYTVTSGGCSTMVTKVITVNAVPVVSAITGATSVCAGLTTTYSSTTTGGVWSSSNTSIATVNANGVVTGVASGSAEIRYTVTSGGCAPIMVTKVITVNAVPTTPTITQRNDTLTSSSTGASYNWYKNGVFYQTTTTNTLKITQNGVYTVEVVGTNTCKSNLSAAFNASLTGVKNNKLDIQYAVIPNPNNGSFEIKLTSVANKAYQLKLYNVSGQIIYSEELNVRIGQNSKQINLNGIEKGIYLLTLIGDDGVSTQNIIIQ